MEMNQNQMQGTIKLKASELMKKFRHKEDRYNFCRQRGKEMINIFFNIL